MKATIQRTNCNKEIISAAAIPVGRVGRSIFSAQFYVLAISAIHRIGIGADGIVSPVQGLGYFQDSYELLGESTRINMAYCNGQLVASVHPNEVTSPKVTAEELPVGRMSSAKDGFTILKLSTKRVLVISNEGNICLGTDPKAWDIARELLPEGSTITITT